MTKDEEEQQRRLLEALQGPNQDGSTLDQGPKKPIVSATKGPAEISTLKKAKADPEGHTPKSFLEGIKPGTATAIGSLAGPYGTAAGAVVDVGLAVYQENRKAKRENMKAKEEAQVRGWNMMSGAAAERNAREQTALKQLMGVGS